MSAKNNLELWSQFHTFAAKNKMRELGLEKVPGNLTHYYSSKIMYKK